MKTVIIKRNAYGYGKHKLNPLFEDFAKHCGFKIKVHRPYRPKTKGKVERFNHYLRYSFHNALKVKLVMQNYEMNVDSANAEVLKWLDNRANKLIHQTTLQQPFKLLADERPHLLRLPKPYNGIHPKVIIGSIVKNNHSVKSSVPIASISIPNRDLQNYDSLIPSLMLLTASYAIYQGVTLWS